MKIHVFRHGQSPYKQGRVSLTEADDLTQEGVEVVRDSASYLARNLNDSPIQIHTSPFGRCLYTAKIIGETLSNKGFNISGIKEDDSLGEVENFEWNLFHPLVLGGEVEYNGRRFELDKNQTNPNDLDFVRYFRNDSAHDLPIIARSNLPTDYLTRVGSFERYPSVLNRLKSKLISLPNEKGITNIICTHEALTGDFAEQIARSTNAFLDRGKYITINNRNGILSAEASQEDSVVTEGY